MFFYLFPSFSYPCRWNKDSIIILDQVVLNPPYAAEGAIQLENCNDAGFARLVKIVSIHRYLFLYVGYK